MSDILTRVMNVTPTQRNEIMLTTQAAQYTVVCYDECNDACRRYTIHGATRRFDRYNDALEYACQRWAGGDAVEIVDCAGDTVYTRA